MAKSKKRREPFTRLSIHERSVIEVRWCTDGKSVRSIGRELGRHHTTVQEEIGGRPRRGTGRYRALRAQREADARIQGRGRKKKLDHEPLLRYMKEKMTIGWSPEQIAVRLKKEHPDDPTIQVSHETIYTYIYGQINRQGHGTVKEGCEDLRGLLPRRRKRRMKQGMRKAQKLERDCTLPSVEDMPEESTERKVIGHWQGDTVVSRKSATRIKSINELKSGVVFFEKTEDGTAQACNEATVRRMRDIPERYCLTLLQDRGSENMHWRQIEEKTGITCYFAHPYCSHERGANENANGLLRRLFPKGTDFGEIKDVRIAEAEYLLNTRPRKRLNGLTPYEVFYHETGIDLQSVAYSRMTGVGLEP